MAGCLISLVQEIGRCILTQCVSPSIDEIRNCILTQHVCPPIKSHFDYWWCFDNNIQGLRDGIEKLKQQKHDIEQKIEEARLRTDILFPEVEEWLKASTEKLEEAQKILLPDDNIPKACRLISRYSMGKNAKETAEVIAKLLTEGNFNPIAYPAPPAAMASPPRRSTPNFESRKGIEDEIIYSLKQSSVGMIGICGMGGVGKTTMAERIGERVKEEDLFDEVVMVTVSQTIDMLKIQNEIAELLGMKFEVESISARAHKLRTRLMDKKRKIIILDDVWDPSLRFEDLGIHIESNFDRCKVLLTSRSRDSCNRIKNKVVFDLKILKEEEAWILFKEKAGECVEHSSLRRVAEDVVEECKGLPLALVTVGVALQDKTNINIWEDSLLQLRRSNPKDFPEVLTNVYKPLKLSYDYLENDSERYLFLMCCLFPEDYNIPIEQLSWYSLGLRLFDDITNIEEARNRTHRLVEKLKSRSLLVHIPWQKAVKMHDVVRDVAIYIGSKGKNGFLKSLPRTSMENSSDVNCNWMSVDISNERIEIPQVSLFPKLQFLMLLKSRSSSNKLFDTSFEGMKYLNVLSFEEASIGSLPPTLGSLENLQTLCLFHCSVKNISLIGKLTSLKILSCYECEYITELPAEIGRLSDLRLLELNGCQSLQRIPFGVISKLTQLEELKMRESFRRWEAEENGKERRNASLTELECLRNLSCLEIEIGDCTLSEICLSLNLVKNLVKYYIRIGSPDTYYFENIAYGKVMILQLPSDIGAVGKWIQNGVRNTEWLHLEGDGCGSNNFNIAEIENLRFLRVRNCSTLKKPVETKDCKFHNLKSIRIISCPELRSLFSVSVGRTSLLQLEVLRIGWCESMEQVFCNEDTDDNRDGFIEFPKLKELMLRKLPNLTAFCQGLENIVIKFPNLTQMEIGELPKLNSLCPLNSETLVWHDHTTPLHFLCNPKVEMHSLKSLLLWDTENNIRNIWCHQIPNNVFNNLEKLQIESMNGIRSLMSTSIAKNLASLKSLEIIDCEEMVEVIEREDDDKQVAESLSLGGDGSDNINIAEMENLKNLQFTNCSTVKKLVDTSYLNQNVSLCNLEFINIESCPKLRSLFSVSVARTSLLQLEDLWISECESMEQVFWNEVRDDNTDGFIEFPKLTELRLESLQNLTAFCQGLENIIIKFPNLTEISIGGLPKLNSLSPLNSETLVWHDQNTCFHFVCSNSKVEMHPLKVLELGHMGNNIRNIWCHQIPNNVFKNLETLEIESMNGIRSLMSTSIAKNLVSLEYLVINDCEEMIEVIERDDVDKQVVDIKCLFPNLNSLKIESMPKLRWFWQWNHALELPLLEEVDISSCPVMKTFTLGSVNTPHISKIEVNSKIIEDQKELNDVIRHIWTESQIKDKGKNKDVDEEGNGDENENKDEDGYEEENKDDQDHFRI